MSSELHDRKTEMLHELLDQLSRRRRARATRRRAAIAAGALGAIALPLSMQLYTPSTTAPSHNPIAITPAAISRVARIRTDPTILDRIRIETAPMARYYATDEQIVAFMANTDEPIGVMHIGSEARIVSARFVEPLPQAPPDEEGGT